MLLISNRQSLFFYNRCSGNCPCTQVHTMPVFKMRRTSEKIVPLLCYSFLQVHLTGSASDGSHSASLSLCGTWAVQPGRAAGADKCGTFYALPSFRCTLPVISSLCSLLQVHTASSACDGPPRNSSLSLRGTWPVQPRRAAGVAVELCCGRPRQSCAV